jgi:hypothetical protein
MYSSISRHPPHRRNSPLRLTLLGSLAAILGTPAWAGESCQLADLAGRYVGLDNGYAHVHGSSVPAARLYVEQWNPDGRVSGTVWQRQGQRFRSMSYTGRVSVDAECSGRVSRQLPTGAWESALLVSPDSRQSYSLDLTPGSTISGTLAPQPEASCSAETLQGIVMSTQMGFSLARGRWKPNAVIQREEHDGKGNLAGLAISSYAGKPEYAHYTGRFDIQPDCTGSLRETDSLGNRYNYRVVVMGTGEGYYYLQTDPNDLTGAYLGSGP